MSWPFLSTTNTTRAFASWTSLSVTAWTWANSSSYITIWGLAMFRAVLLRLLRCYGFLAER